MIHLIRDLWSGWQLRRAIAQLPEIRPETKARVAANVHRLTAGINAAQPSAAALAASLRARCGPFASPASGPFASRTVQNPCSAEKKAGKSGA